eukprot:14662185-Alexandrium_andersonii.AAC.1
MGAIPCANALRQDMFGHCCACTHAFRRCFAESMACTPPAGRRLRAGLAEPPLSGSTFATGRASPNGTADALP